LRRIANPARTTAITREVEMFKFLAYYYGILFFLKAFGIGENDSSNNQGDKNA